jgi:Icc-related predicted phosphoesterase
MTDIVCISDTHCLHKSIDMPDGDILVHAGDFCGYGHLGEVSQFLDWLETLPHKTKIVVPGNHDVCLEENFDARKEFEKAGVHLLIDEAYTDPESGLKFYGVPWTPDFFPDNWGFQYRDAPKDVWDAVPPDTDFIVSHGPPLGVADQIIPHVNDHLGSAPFAKRLEELSKHQFIGVICGHIHGGYGEHFTLEGIPVVNASICTEGYQPTNEAIIWKL